MSFMPSGRYVGPDNEIRTGAPEYQGGRIYPVNEAAHAKLREALGVPAGGIFPEKAAVDMTARRIADAFRRREQEAAGMGRPKRNLGRTTINEAEMDELKRLLRDNASEAMLARWRRELGINGNSFRRLVRQAREEILYEGQEG